MVVWWAVALSGCCGGPAPAWQSTDAIYLGNDTVTVDLDTLIVSPRADLEYTVSTDPDVVTELDGSLLTLTPQPGWQGETLLLVTATDPCGGIADLDLDVRSGADPDARPETYEQGPQVAFRQVFLSPDRRGNRIDRDAAALLETLEAAGPGRQGNRETGDRVGTIIYLAADASKFVTGQTLMVDGGTVML